MSQPSNPNNTPYPVIDESKIPPEVAIHLRLLYEKITNHAQAIQNLHGRLPAPPKEKT